MLTWLFDAGLLSGVQELFAMWLDTFVLAGGAKVIVCQLNSLTNDNCYYTGLEPATNKRIVFISQNKPVSITKVSLERYKTKE